MQTSRGIAARSRSAGDWLAEARRCEREGELFQAYDIAMQGLARFPRDLALKHRAVLCLASTQATTQAIDLFGRLGLDLADSALASLPPAIRMDIPCLKARLRKDDALNAAGEARRSGLREAASLMNAAIDERPRQTMPRHITRRSTPPRFGCSRTIAIRPPIWRMTCSRGSMPARRRPAITNWSAPPKPASSSAR